MKIAAFQFRGSDNLQQNLRAITRGIEQAARENVRLLLTQECALCGYPPIETPTPAQIDFEELAAATAIIQELALRHGLYIALGTIQPSGEHYFNSIELIAPDGPPVPPYHKRALWGWDAENFIPGHTAGVYTFDELRIGIRICYEVRFPEYFRELFREKVDVALVSFCDVSPEENPARYELIRSHLITRAVENALFVVSANSLSQSQTAPTCIIDPDGQILHSAPRDEECLLVSDIAPTEPNFGRAGRIKHSRELLGML